MKKRFLFTVIIIGIMAVPSLKAQFRIGPGLGFVTETRTLLVSASANYDLSQNFGVEAGYNYIFPKTSTHKWYGLDLDGTYTFVRENEKGKLYVLAGLNLLHYSYPSVNSSTTVKSSVAVYSSEEVNSSGAYSHSYIGANIGVGWRLAIAGKMELVPETVVTIGELSYLRLGLKLMFSL